MSNKLTTTQIIEGQTKGQEDLKKLAFANLNVCINKGMQPTTELARNCLSISALRLNIGTDEAYLIGFKDKLQIQIGYKGLLQLAYRTNQYKELGVSAVKEIDIVKVNKFNGKIEVEFNENYIKREQSKTIGYLGYFELKTGLQQTLFMSVEEIEKHAKKYSQTYKKGFGVWKDNFNVMAEKTIIKLLINRKGPKSVELQTALTIDQGVIDNQKDPLNLIELKEDINYPDNEKIPAEDIKTIENNEVSISWEE